MTSATISQMAWTNGERISLSYFSDNPGLKKTLLKMLVLDSNAATSQNKSTVNKKAAAMEQQQQLDIKQNVGEYHWRSIKLSFIFTLVPITVAWSH